MKGEFLISSKRHYRIAANPFYNLKESSFDELGMKVKDQLKEVTSDHELKL